MAFSLECSENFKNFNSFDFLTKYKNDEITDYEFDVFLKMCFSNNKLNKDQQKEIQKAKSKSK